MPVIGDVPEINLKAIVFATDFSDTSQIAGQYAGVLAKYFACPLVVAHAFTLSQAAMEVEASGTLQSQQRKDLEAKLDDEVRRIKYGSGRDSSILMEGDPKEQIPRVAEQNAPCFIVLGTHGGSPVSRKLIGSVAEEILRSTRWPCLTVGPKVPSSPNTLMPLKRILYATDSRPAALGAAVYAMTCAEVFGAEIDVLNVIPEDVVRDPARLTELTSQFYAALDQLFPKRMSEFFDPRTFVEVGKAHEQILSHIQERSIDLLILGIEKSSHLGLTKRVSGAFQLIVDAKCAVLTIAGR